MSTIKTNTLQNTAGTLSVPVDTVVQGSAKAWVNFNGTGTVAILAAFNVSSITDVAVGIYTLNFATAMSDANYCITTSSPSFIDGTKCAVGLSGGANGTPVKSTTATQIAVGQANALVTFDALHIDVAILR